LVKSLMVVFFFNFLLSFSLLRIFFFYFVVVGLLSRLNFYFRLCNFSIL
jgi:hypothetical protein